MYPQYWTPSIGGNFMKYSYEFKLMCVDLYRQGKWPDTPEGIKDKPFHDMIRIWVRQEDAGGAENLQHKEQNRIWGADEKYEFIAQVLAGKSYREVAISAGIESRLLYEWVRRYKMNGYEGLVAKRKGRPPKEPDMKKKVALYGQYYARTATEVYSPLKTVAAAFESDGEQFITASLDLVNFQQDFHRKIRAAAAAIEPEINPEKIFLNAIHTHTGPSVTPTGAANAWRERDNDTLAPEEYVEFVIPIIAQNIVNAWRNRKTGGIVRAFGNARIGHCRRAVFADGTAEMYGDTTRLDFIGMEAGEDTGIEMLFTVDENGRKTGMFLNVACPSQVMEASCVISSDFAGATRELLKKEYGEDFHTIYQIS